MRNKISPKVNIVLKLALFSAAVLCKVDFVLKPQLVSCGERERATQTNGLEPWRSVGCLPDCAGPTRPVTEHCATAVHVAVWLCV